MVKLLVSVKPRILAVLAFALIRSGRGGEWAVASALGDSAGNKLLITINLVALV
jgi:hypothetical protein